MSKTLLTITLAALIAATVAYADVLFGTYTAPTTNKDQPSTYLAMDDWLSEKGPKQSIRVNDIGWGPVEKLKQQIELVADTWRWSGAVPLVKWQPYPFQTWTNPAPCSDIANGLYDYYIDNFLTMLSTLYVYATPVPRLVYLDFAPAPNGNWYPWSPSCPSCSSTGQNIKQTPADYVAMWNHVMKMVRDPKYNLTKDVLQVVFDVAAVDESAKLEEFFPTEAADTVDWMSVTGDNFGTALPGNNWVTPAQLLSGPLSRLSALAPSKPLAITSAASGSVPNGVTAKNEWISKFYGMVGPQASAPYSSIKMMCYYNADSNTDLAAFGGAHGLTNWSSPVSSSSYYVYPALRDAVSQKPFVGCNVSNPTYITKAQFFGLA